MTRAADIAYVVLAFPIVLVLLARRRPSVPGPGNGAVVIVVSGVHRPAAHYL